MKKIRSPRFLILLSLMFLSVYTIKAQQIDILLKGGHVIDPKNGIDAIMDVAISNGKISAVGKNIPTTNALKVVDVAGLYVTPGVIDIHEHTFYGTDEDSWLANARFALQPDAFSFRSGVTTVVDAGCSGWRNFRQFKRQTIDKSRTRVLAFLNIVGGGMFGRIEEQDLTDMNPTVTSLMIKEYRDIIVGIKAPHFLGEFQQVDSAVKAGNLANVPVMVDFGEHFPPNSIKDLFMIHLRPGDIYTHTFSTLREPRGRESIVDDETGILKPFILEAQKRGIIFDVGHGAGAFSWSQAIPAIEQGFKPNTISTDLYYSSMNAGMKDMSNVMSKFLALGLTIQDVILRSTWNPAQVIHRPDLGNLSVGTEADVTVFNLQTGNFGFVDVRGLKVRSNKKLVAELTVRAGRVAWDLNGISASDYVKPASYK